jgi:3-phosphoshikimate 1-carboxyvinyltransferase
VNVVVGPSAVNGVVKTPPSKSYTHRAILGGCFAGRADIRNSLRSEDTKATIRAARLFGAEITVDGSTVHVDAPGEWPLVPADVLDCANSGTTIRLTTGVSALVDGTTVLTGDESLRSRPQGGLLDAIEQLGGRASSTRGNGRAPVVVSGPIDDGVVSMPGGVTSQFVSALLLVGGVTEGGITVEPESPVNGVPYIEITEDFLGDFEIRTRRTEGGYTVPGSQRFSLADDSYTVPGDFSSASYLLAAGAVGGDVTVTGLQPSAQGDKAILDVLDRMGADVTWNRADGRATVSETELSGVAVDVTDIPDLLPTIAVLGSVASGTTRIENCEHVRDKETDRVSAMAAELSSMGAVVEETRDSLVIRGKETELVGAVVDGRKDHRLVMALAIAALAADGPTKILGSEHVDVSFPAFFDRLRGLGVEVTEE